MVVPLKSQGSISGQEIGHSKNKKTDLPQNLDLINLIQEALGQGTTTKQEHFSDVLGTLKQTQIQSSIPSNHKIFEKNQDALPTQFRLKDTVDSSSITPKKEKIKESHLVKESNLVKEQPIEKITTAPEMNKKPNPQKIETQQIKNEPTQNINNALEYDFISTLNSQEKTIFPVINHSNIASINGALQTQVPHLLETTTETQNSQKTQLDPQLKSQINQWVNEDKVQIQKILAPLEIVRPSFPKIEMTTEEIPPKGQIELGIKTDSFLNQVLDTPLKLKPPIKIDSSLNEDAPIKPELKQKPIPFSTQSLNQTKTIPLSQPIQVDLESKQSQNFNFTQTKSPTVRETQMPGNKMAEDRKVMPTAINSTNANHAPIPQPLSMGPLTKATDNPTTNKATAIQEVSDLKSALGQNKISQNPSGNTTGKMITSTKALTMTEKIQALQQVKSQMKAALQKGETHLLVKLTPDDLGKVDIRLDISRDGNVSALFKTENRETMVLLSKYADDFRQIFGESGLNSDMSGMNFSSSDQQASQFDQITKALGKNVPLIGNEEEIMAVSEISKDFAIGMSQNQRLNITV